MRHRPRPSPQSEAAPAHGVQIVLAQAASPGRQAVHRLLLHPFRPLLCLRVPQTACQEDPAAPELLADLRCTAGHSLQQHGGDRHVGGALIPPWHTVIGILPLLPHKEEGQEKKPDTQVQRKLPCSTKCVLPSSALA
jgi:hypothetical protein